MPWSCCKTVSCKPEWVLWAALTCFCKERSLLALTRCIISSTALWSLCWASAISASLQMRKKCFLNISEIHDFRQSEIPQSIFSAESSVADVTIYLHICREDIDFANIYIWLWRVDTGKCWYLSACTSKRRIQSGGKITNIVRNVRFLLCWQKTCKRLRVNTGYLVEV